MAGSPSFVLTSWITSMPLGLFTIGGHDLAGTVENLGRNGDATSGLILGIQQVGSWSFKLFDDFSGVENVEDEWAYEGIASSVSASVPLEVFACY